MKPRGANNLFKKLRYIQNKHIEPSKWKPQIFHEDDKYYYYYSQEKKVVKVDKEYKPRDGYVRLSWLEGVYRWWKYRTEDGKNAIIPIILSFGMGYTIFELAMQVSERDYRMIQRAKIPEEFTEENLKENQELKKQIEEWKRNKEESQRVIQELKQQE